MADDGVSCLIPDGFRMGEFSMRIAIAAATCAFLAIPAQAQDAAGEDLMAGSVYDGDYLSVGVGVGYGPSYDGSDDYVLFPAPLVQGSLGGVGISPRGAGLALDFIPDADEGISFDAGIAARMRANRARQIKDPVVYAAGKLDIAVEVGPTVGISIPKVLHGYDSLSFTVDTRWDVAGAHRGMVIDPSVTYFTPLSTAIAASLTVSAEYGDRKFRDYYYSVSTAQSLASGLPLYQPDGGGFTKAGATLFLGYDLDGDLRNGGWGLVGLAGYSRMLGDAKASPYVALRGSPDQFFGGLGVGYTF